MLGFVIFIAAFVVFDILAVRFGVDSRIGSTDPRSPESPVGIR